ISTINGSTVVTVVSDLAAQSAQNFYVGMPVSGPNIPVGALVTSIIDSKNFTISAAATATANGVATIDPGSASITSGSTTVTLSSGTTDPYYIGMPISGSRTYSGLTVLSSSTSSATVTVASVPATLLLGSTLLGQTVTNIFGNTITLSGNADTEISSSSSRDYVTPTIPAGATVTSKTSSTVFEISIPASLTETN